MAPIFRDVRADFFKSWSKEMAYVLGYFAADGAMIKNKRGAHFIEFHSTDKELIVSVRRVLHSDHKIGVRKPKEDDANHKVAYRVQIGSKEMFSDLTRLGMTQNKSKTIRLPSIPPAYIGDFVRGYFDGDGNVYFKQHYVKARNKNRWVFSSRFTSGSKDLLRGLHRTLRLSGIRKGFIVDKSIHRGYDLVLSHHDSVALYRLMYHNLSDSDIYLVRKYKLFTCAIETLYGKTRV